MISLKKRLNSYYFRVLNGMLERLWAQGKNAQECSGIVLMFHHVTDEELPNQPRTCVSTVAAFQHTIEVLSKQGYTFMSIYDIVKINYGKSIGKYAAVTFDDVPESVLINAIPYLRSKGIPYTLFITVGYLETEGFINESSLKSLATDTLCTIGGHTQTHPDLRKSANLEEEIINSKRNLESIIGKEVKCMAYPYGTLASVSRHVRKVVKEAGFDYAFSTIPASLNRRSIKSKYFLPRVVTLAKS